MTKTNVAIIFASIAAVLVAAALPAAFAVKPPMLGWVGFAIVALIVFGLGAVATLALPRLRVSAAEPAVVFDQERRLLVVADSYCSELALCDEILAHLDGAVAVHLVVPVRVSVGMLRRRGVPTTGAVGTDKPLESMTDALGFFPATHVLLAIPPAEESYWLEQGLLAKARELTAAAITQVVVPSTAPDEAPAAPTQPVATEMRKARGVRVANGRGSAERRGRS